jgi:hypothetical protein
MLFSFSIPHFLVFLTLFEKHQREGRVILPLLKTIDLLISRVCIDELIQDVIFSRSLLQHLEEEEKECKDVHRLFAIINVSLGLLRGTGMEKVIIFPLIGCVSASAYCIYRHLGTCSDSLLLYSTGRLQICVQDAFSSVSSSTAVHS